MSNMKARFRGWRPEKGRNPEKERSLLIFGIGRLVRGWNPKNEHSYSFSELEGGGGGKQRWSKPRKRVRMLVFGVGRGMVESVNM